MLVRNLKSETLHYSCAYTLFLCVHTYAGNSSNLLTELPCMSGLMHLVTIGLGCNNFMEFPMTLLVRRVPCQMFVDYTIVV